jgi:predicted  nucleic acid-binding Zn-ribbon protein
MSGTAELMREVHALRRFAKELQEQIDRAPRQLKAQQAKAAGREEAVKENADAIKKLKVAAHEKEVTLKTTQNQIAKHQKQLNEAASKKEYDALQHEIAADKETCQRLEDEVLSALGEGEERAARAPELEAAVKKAKEEFAEWEKSSKERREGWARQLAETQAKLKEVEAGVPDRVRGQYDRIVRAMGVDGFAAVQDRGCSACRTEITAQHYNDLLSNAFALCKSCGRILYLPEAPPPSDDDDDAL